MNQSFILLIESIEKEKKRSKKIYSLIFTHHQDLIVFRFLFCFSPFSGDLRCALEMTDLLKRAACFILRI
jgi:hypothetical protein